MRTWASNDAGRASSPGVLGRCAPRPAPRRCVVSVLALCVAAGGCGAVGDDTRSAFTCTRLEALAAGVSALKADGHELQPNVPFREMLAEVQRSGYTEGGFDSFLYDAWGHEPAWSVLQSEGQGTVISFVSGGIDGIFGNDDDLTVCVVTDPDGAIQVVPCCVGYGRPYWPNR
jgi:hypothetical protein